jgi:hypothetical protein
MKASFLALLFVSVAAGAQVKVCVDAKGKKTFTDYECEKIGQQRADTIQDINITPKQCPAIKDAIVNSQNSIARMDATRDRELNPMFHTLRNIQVQQLEANQQRFHRECER